MNDRFSIFSIHQIPPKNPHSLKSLNLPYFDKNPYHCFKTSILHAKFETAVYLIGCKYSPLFPPNLILWLFDCVGWSIIGL